ncbi:MAG: hypothetical protein WAW39_09930 [Prosthecobacter sp.]|uniref:hypothetical protein n=1 Tax=Prosthecobacter sp. TaxID=1965333 RepID=UPI003BB0A4DB
MKAFLLIPNSKKLVIILSVAFSLNAMAQSANNCADICNDVKTAVEKDPSKVLMILEDALVINEGCAGDIVKIAITASKADETLAGQIAQTGVSVAPKMEVAINEAATSLFPGLKAVTVAAERPIAVSGKNPVFEKNPGKNPVLDSPEPKTLDSPEPSISMGPVRGVFLMPPVSGPLPPRTTTNPVSPSNAIP